MTLTEFIEILMSILAVFGGYCILDIVKFGLLYKKKIRRKLRASVILDDPEELSGIFEYAKYLRGQNKISGERLIILVNDDIIRCMDDFSDIYRYGDVFRYTEFPEVGENYGIHGGRQKSCDNRGNG